MLPTLLLLLQAAVPPSTSESTVLAIAEPVEDDHDVGWWDRIEFGGHARARFESFKGFNFDLPPVAQDTDTYLLTRIVLDATMPLGERGRAFVQVKGAWSNDRELPGGRRPLDADPLDLQQAWAELPLPGGGPGVRLGRMSLNYGSQRVISPLPWGNTLRAWDGGMLRWKGDRWDVDAFVTWFVPVDFEEFNEADRDDGFHGVYATSSDEAGGVDLYALYSDRAFASYNGTSGSEERITLGARSFRKPARAAWDWDVEGAYQLGEVGDGDVRAYQVGAEGGYTWDHDVRPRTWIGFDVGSGDDEPGGDVETFQQLFPLAHAYLGIADVFARQNLIDASFGASCVLEGGVKASIAYHAFWLHDADDAVYNAGGGAFVPGGTSDSRWASQEIDAVVTAPLGDGFTLEVGAAGVTGERVFQVAGADEDLAFAYVQLLYRL